MYIYEKPNVTLVALNTTDVILASVRLTGAEGAQLTSLQTFDWND